MSDLIACYIGGVVSGMLLLMVLIIYFEPGPATVYRKAYEDMKTGKIESVVKKEYPDLWIKWNIPDTSEETK
jgi:hypothetical protein